MSVYFITARALGQVKIGTSDKPYLRLKALQTGSPVPLALERLIDGGVEDERALHGRFSGLRLSGEWFELTAELEAFMATLAEPPTAQRRKCAPTEIGDLRAELGMTLTQFGAAIGLSSKGQVSQVEHGKFPCSLSVALEIERLSGGRIDAARLNDDVRRAREGVCGDHADPFTDAALAPATGQNGELSGGVAL